MEPVYTYFEPSVEPSLTALLAEADAASEALRQAGVPKTAERSLALEEYERGFVVRMTHGSASIEGSRLTLRQTALVIDREFVPRNIGERNDMMAALGISEAWRFARHMVEEGRPLSRILIQDIHERVAMDMDDSVRGLFRTGSVTITGTTAAPPDASRVRECLDDAIYLFEDSGLHPIMAVAAFHAAFENIHPFVDGNGRTGRVLIGFQLLKKGYPPIAIDADSRRDYLEALDAWTDTHDAAPLVAYLCSNIVDEARRRIEVIRGA